ncbi:hypothetical protein [Pelagibacterium luteolum]|uniref:Membrane-anchored ribosome-binding protein, inhibits growth in stationary phase, ElaB/YqjD/DUF883 family n=1 Tax=Pelagibacterium luteolum TaxID=440168 RepID=A0A1G7Y5F4_9HYPH|nr:hypothetical protein [Pelagibacterium luteolum]SDG91609.1 hypothetical protein SAMN04487974_11261 [Pelagibacterium luteolum]
MADFSFANGINKNLDHQVRDLRKQLQSISKTLADNGIDFDELSDEAEDLWRGARKNARRASKQVQRDIEIINKAAHKAPAATGTVLAVAAIVGFGLGYLYHISQR